MPSRRRGDSFASDEVGGGFVFESEAIRTQVVATVAQMMWARGSEKALRENTLEVWYQTQLDDLQGLITKIRSDLTSLQRKCVVALVTTDVHARDIVEDLKNKGVNRVDDFNWMQQLRYYWESVGADSASELQGRVDGVDGAVRASTGLVPRRRRRGLPDSA